MKRIQEMNGRSIEICDLYKKEFNIELVINLNGFNFKTDNLLKRIYLFFTCTDSISLDSFDVSTLLKNVERTWA